MKTTTLNHPSYQRAANLYRLYASGRMTLSSLVNFRRNRPCFKAMAIDTPLPLVHYLQREQYRKSLPEAKRARKDKKFRKGYLRRAVNVLNRHMGRRYNSTEALTKDYAQYRSEQYAKIFTHYKDSLNIIKPRGTDVFTYAYSKAFLPLNAALVPSAHASFYEEQRIKLVRRGDNWKVKSTFGDTDYYHEDGQTTWRGGKPIKYTRATNISYIRQFAVLIDEKTIKFCVHTKECSLNAPADHYWGIDVNGLKLVRNDNMNADFHPNVKELWDAQYDNCKQLILFLNNKFEQREKEFVRMRVEKAKAQEVFVCFRDSLRAGNCAAGSESFASRFSLDIHRHYNGAELLEKLNNINDTYSLGRLRLAISSAIHRHKIEMARGYALLEEHRVAW